ncbi:lipid IV(A) 3-deoxy-D-manno-octulosonic acid transferase [Rhodocyclus tenuis]|uniref:lipid IV(A) 3-deoxy-D-manno-octulosonic acid transferase n=1 Tax=Rhodocyclus tenuis TaxID=1066 RepID=UPI0030B8A112
MMLRALYSTAFTLAQPLLHARLAWRARRQPEYREHVGERWGHYPDHHAQIGERPLLWLHAVSVGETRAAAPLVDALLAAHPQHALLLTHMTPTGRATGAELVARHPGRIVQAYLPYDLPGACARFFAHFQPERGLIMETEIWPNLCAAAAARGVPLALVNARLSARSATGYARIRGLIEPALASLSVIAAQTEADAERLRALGARRVVVCGNIKFDVTPAPDKLALGAAWKTGFVSADGATRPVLLAASTRDGEEALLLDALSGWLAGVNASGSAADATANSATNEADAAPPLLLLVPRHPQRFDEVAALVAERGLSLARRSSFAGAVALPPGTQVLLGDSMGEMAAYYATADLALIGGSLLPFGAQNLIEAAACGCPTLVGPHSFNFAQATADAIAAGAARRVADAADAANTARALLADEKALALMRECALAFSRAHRGATARTLAAVFAD